MADTTSVPQIESDQSHEKEYAEVFHEVIEKGVRLLGLSRLRAILEHLPANHELTPCIRISGSDVTLARNGLRALPLLVDVLTRQHLRSQRAQLKNRVLHSCRRRGVPLPQMGIGAEELGADMSGYWLG